MSGSQTSSLEPEGPHLRVSLDPSKIGIAGAIVADALQIVAAALQLASETKVFVYVLALLTGVSFIAWSSQHLVAAGKKGRASSLPTIVFVAGTFVALVVLAWPAIMQVIKEQPPVDVTYYLRVTVYGDENHDGTLDGLERPLGNIPVATRDRYGRTATSSTGRDGVAEFSFPSLGDVAVGVCGTYQSHSVGSSATSKGNAARVSIGIDPMYRPMCR